MKNQVFDWDSIVDRYELAFARENHDRPAMSISFPNGKQAEMPPTPPTVHEQWFNFDWRIDCFERQLEGIDYMYEGFPTCWCNLGPDILAGFMGSELRFENTFTSWVKHDVADWANVPPLRFQREGWMWQQMEKYLSLAGERSQGRWLVGSGDLHTNADGLEALRGADSLLLDLIDQPDEIKKRLRECHEVFKLVLQAHFDIIHRWSPYNSSWMNAACRGSYVIIQNDFCCMVGPDMFDEFFSEYVQLEAQEADRSIYHLDGPGAVRHLESIASAPDLDMIQWVPGAGAKPLPEWKELLLKIQSLNKGLWLYGTGAEVITMMEYMRPEGCIYDVHCNSREEAEAVVKTCKQIYG